MGKIMSMTGANAATGANCNCDKKKVSGTEAKLFYSPFCEINVFPDTLEESGNGTGAMSDRVTLDGDIIMDDTVQGCGFFREYDIIINSGKVLDTGVGEIGSKSFDSDIPFRIEGTDPEHLGFAAHILNCKGTFIIKTKTGVTRVSGSKTSPAYIESVVLDTGDTPESANQGTYVVRSNTGVPAYVYNGVIDLTPTP